MPDIFLSYSRDDQTIARRFAEGFEREGFSVWWDQTLRSGEAYDKVTEKALEEARAVVVLWSKTSVDSRWVRSEATQADRYGTLVPVMIEQCKRPIMFELTHTADLIKWKGDPGDPAWQSYVADVRGFVHKDASVARPAKPVASGRSRFSGLQIAISAAVVLVAGALLFWGLNRTSGVPGTAASTTAATAPVSLAVLPFANPDGSEGGRVLAFGVAEAVLHQLANLSELSVISWSSASEIDNETQDIRQIAKELGVAYLLQGSVQRNGEVLRVTARLVEAATERSVWSLRLDRQQKDVFSIQDEISAQVTRALSVSVSPEGRERMRGQGTHNVEAYLAFLEGQDALSTWRSHEAGIAATHFNRAVGLDPQFARAIVMLVRARMRDAEYSTGSDQREQVAKALTELAPVVERALMLDPRLGEAYVERGYLRRFEDPVAAERDYRKAIELTPSNARAYQQLADLLWEEPSRRREVADLLERARTLDPLDPDLAVSWAVYQNYNFANYEEAEALLRQVLERNPQYLPALVRRGEILTFGMGRPAEGIRVFEEVMELDPDSDYVRRLLVQGYIFAGDFDSARRLTRQPGATGISQMFLDLAERRVDNAARLAYDAIDAGTLTGNDQWAAVESVNQEARRTRDFSTASEALDELLNISWTESGIPTLNRNRGLLGDVVAYAGMLRAAGESDRATALVNAASQAIDADERERGGVNRWNTIARARVAALRGDKSTALANLETSVARDATCWYWIAFDPVFEPLRGTPEFKLLAATFERRRAQTLQALRAP